MPVFPWLLAAALAPAQAADAPQPAPAAPQATAQAAPADKADAVSIPYQKYTLPNGLDVILSEDHSVPVVQVNIWYDVGSKDEVAGRTGFAHLFEHLMFQGSKHMDDDYFVPLQKIGGRVNGSTTFDRTNFFEGVPSEDLPTALWLESDRMGWLLDALTPDKLQNQKDVVRNERRQRYEITPYGKVWIWLFENLYPVGHPYHEPTIGEHEDIEAATMDDVKAFFRKWYVPSNASLVICGDFDPKTAKGLVEKYFGDIPAGGPAQHKEVQPVQLTQEKVVRKYDDVPYPKVWIAWLTPKLYAPGDADLDILSSVLTDGKDSRLYKKLVYEDQIAKDVTAYQYSARLQSQYIIEATPAAGHTTDEVVAAIDKELAEIRKDGPTTDEVSVARTNWKAQFYDGLQTVANKADLLNSYNTVTGDPGYITKDLARYMAVTADSVHDVVDQYLDPNRRVVLHVLPKSMEPVSTDATPAKDAPTQATPAAPARKEAPDAQ